MSYASDIAEITQLVLRERQGRDRGWWDQLAESYWPDGQVNISWFKGSGREFASRSKEMTSSGARALHRMGPPIVQIKGHRAFVEVSGSVEFRIDMNGVLADLISYTRFYWKVERRNGVWRVKLFTVVYERDTLMPALPGQTLDIDPSIFKQFRPSYAMLGYYLTSRGFPTTNDLVGDDQPEGVDAFVESMWTWLDTDKD